MFYKHILFNLYFFNSVLLYFVAIRDILFHITHFVSGATNSEDMNESSTPVKYIKWPKENIDRLMEIYWEMKSLRNKNAKNDWGYVSRKLFSKLGREYTNMECKKKVRAVLLSEVGDKCMEASSDMYGPRETSKFYVK